MQGLLWGLGRGYLGVIMGIIIMGFTGFGLQNGEADGKLIGNYFRL